MNMEAGGQSQEGSGSGPTLSACPCNQKIISFVLAGLCIFAALESPSPRPHLLVESVGTGKDAIVESKDHILFYSIGGEILLSILITTLIITRCSCCYNEVPGLSPPLPEGLHQDVQESYNPCWLYVLVHFWLSRVAFVIFMAIQQAINGIRAFVFAVLLISIVYQVYLMVCIVLLTKQLNKRRNEVIERIFNGPHPGTNSGLDSSSSNPTTTRTELSSSSSSYQPTYPPPTSPEELAMMMKMMEQMQKTQQQQQNPHPGRQRR